MKIYAIQTGTIAVKQAHRKLMGFAGTRTASIFLDWRYTQPLPIYAWLVEHPDGLIVVDTGESAGVMQPNYFETDPEYRIATKYGRMFRWNVSREQEIGKQLIGMGINPRTEVRHVVLTHLHCDHVDGLRYFPKADIWIARAEYSKPHRAFCRWPIWFRPSELIEYHDGAYGAFAHSHVLCPSVRLVPTPGHTFGHQSVVVSLGAVDVMLAGDVVFSQDQLLKGEVAGVVADVKLARESLRTLHQHAQHTPTVFLPSHDPAAAERLATLAALKI